MSIFTIKMDSTKQAPSAFESVARATSYFLYQREPDGIWYAGFRMEGEKHKYKRLSTRTRDRGEADRFVRSHLALTAEVDVEISGFGIERMIERARLRAKRKGLAFGLNAAVVRSAIERCGGRCEVSGHPLELGGPFRPSLDRIDAKGGYTADNVRVVCLITNTAMLHYGRDALIELSEHMCRKVGLIKD